MPLPLRRLIWTIGLNIGRQRANYFGTFAITSLAALGSETVVAHTPGPAFITYGLVQPDHSMELLFHWDHRIYDGIIAARAMRRLEAVLNTEIAEELLALAPTKRKSA
jgi:Cu/Ag efflux pump CusA